VFGLAGRGRVAAGQRADLALVDSDRRADLTRAAGAPAAGIIATGT
jgi:N-acyl-D-aspartate/D-glutamate deacylase